ncbi:hypothetical protein, partial [Aerococcus sp. UMB7533]|uniref:hypothetical protein n=1 Tax=Aerococcus sp. UMB7533 TaxID=3046340 RepID=UPI0025507CE1
TANLHTDTPVETNRAAGIQPISNPRDTRAGGDYFHMPMTIRALESHRDMSRASFHRHIDTDINRRFGWVDFYRGFQR